MKQNDTYYGGDRINRQYIIIFKLLLYNKLKK